MSSEEQRLAEKAANFKGAVETNKTLLQRDSQRRAERFEKVRALLSASKSENYSETVKTEFAETETRRLLAESKRWSTDDFEALRIIGEGGFGIVHLVKHRGTEDYYAMKQMRKGDLARKNYRDRAFAERNILAEARSKWFVTLHFTFQDSDHIFMVMEFLQGGDLMFHLIAQGRFTFSQTRFYMGELLEALDTVHRHGFVHRDVKPDNMVLTAQGHLKLLDFGLCKHTCSHREEQAPETKAKATINLDEDEAPVAITKRRTRLQSVVGTPQYMAPEVLQGSYGSEADIWSLGVLTYECLVGGVPFHLGNFTGPEEEEVRIVQDKVRHFAEIIPRSLQRAKKRQYLTTKSAEFIQRILVHREQRFNAQQCREDPFFFGVEFARLHSMTPPIIPDLKDAVDTSCFDAFDDELTLQRASLPSHTAGYRISKKDASLEWSGYEFNLAVDSR